MDKNSHAAVAREKGLAARPLITLQSPDDNFSSGTGGRGIVYLLCSSVPLCRSFPGLRVWGK